MNFNQIIIQITKVSVAFIFTLIAIGSLASISNSIFSDKVLNELNSKSSDQISRLKLELTTTVKSLEFNKKRIPHTVVGRKELLEQIEDQEKVIVSLAYLSSPERAREYLKNINDKLKDTEDALLHSVIGRENLIKKINY